MPPKKVEPEEKLGPGPLGRFTSNLKVNLVCCPRVTADRVLVTAKYTAGIGPKGIHPCPTNASADLPLPNARDASA